jgi:uncharacterized membrane protein YedE/YeeE
MTWEVYMYPLIGGALIGLAASLLLLLNGKIFGVTGIMAGAFWSSGDDRHWRIASIVGMIAGSGVVYLMFPKFFEYDFDIPIWLMAVAGLAVGFGTRLGSGCTSGHGICGLPRFSPRSLAAVMTFMATGAITTYIFRHVLHLN